MKKILAFIMAMLMILSCFAALSMGVLAAEGDEVTDGENQTPDAGADEGNGDDAGEGEGEGTETPAEPDLSVQYEINFRKYSEDVTAAFAANSNKVTVTKEAKSGYATIEATEGDDPYVVFAGGVDITEEFPITNMSYIVFKYRTNTTNATADFYMNGIKADGPAAGWGTAPAFANFVGDGQWHVAKLDITGWATVEGVVRLQDMRLDIVPAGACVFDLAYVKFFASEAGADAQIAAETITKNAKGELNEGDPAIVELADGFYSAVDLIALTAKEGADGVYVDADNNEYTVRAGMYVMNADGTDTGLNLIADVDGNVYASARTYKLAYLDPDAASVTLDDVKYVYGSKADATVNKKPVAPDGAVAGAKPTTDTFAGQLSTDQIKVNGASLVVDGIGEINGTVEKYKAVYGNNIYDTDKTYTSIGFRGWILDTTAIPDAFGYVINNGEQVWDDSFLVVDPALYTPLSSENPRRYDINIPVADLEDGIYSITLLVKFGDAVYNINTAGVNNTAGIVVWGDDLCYVKGGSYVIDSYSVGADKYTFDDEGALLLNGEAAPASSKLVVTGDTVDTTTAILYTNLEEFSDDATGKYVYDANLTYVATPAVPYNPATLVPGVLFDGADMANGAMSGMTAEYNYEEGYVTYTTVAPGDPNAGSPLVGQTVGRYMVVKYRTTNVVSDSFFFSTKGNIAGSSTIHVSFVADGNWNYMIVDLATTGDFVEGQPLAGTRFDMIADGILDVAFFAFFDDKLAAETYIEEEVWTAPTYYKATFVADGETVKEVMFKAGTTKLTGAPAVPKKDGFTGKWAEYTLADADLTIEAVYTEKETEAPDENETNAPDENETNAPDENETGAPGEDETGAPVEDVTNAPVEDVTNAPVEDATNAPAEDATTADGTVADTAADDAEEESDGCGSVIGFSAVAVVMAAAAAVVLKKKED